MTAPGNPRIFYTQITSKVGFQLRRLGLKIIVLTRALPLGNGHSLRTKILRGLLVKSPTFQAV